MVATPRILYQNRADRKGRSCTRLRLHNRSTATRRIDTTPQPPPQHASCPQSHPKPHNAEPPSKRRIGLPVFITSIVLAGLLGGGAGGRAVHYLDDGAPTASNEIQDCNQLNRTDNVTPTTE